MYVNLIDMSRRQRSYIDLAMDIAASGSQSPCFRHGAVLVTGGRVIRAAANTWKHSSFGTRFRTRGTGLGTHHAEVSCVLGIDRELTEGATVYVIRINREGLLRMSLPCQMCQAVLQFVGVKSVVYSIDEQTFGKLRL